MALNRSIAIPHQRLSSVLRDTQPFSQHKRERILSLCMSLLSSFPIPFGSHNPVRYHVLTASISLTYKKLCVRVPSVSEFLKRPKRHAWNGIGALHTIRKRTPNAHQNNRNNTLHAPTCHTRNTSHFPRHLTPILSVFLEQDNKCIASSHTHELFLKPQTHRIKDSS